MSTTTLGMTTQLNDSFNYSVTDVLSDTVPQNVSLQNTMKMQFGQTSDSSTGTVITATKFAMIQHTITIASSTYDIDLTQLVDIFGNVLTSLSKVYYILIKNNDVSGGSGLTIGGAASNPWTAPFNGVSASRAICDAGGEWRVTSPKNGMNVTAGSKVLRVANNAASPTGNATFTLILAGS